MRIILPWMTIPFFALAACGAPPGGENSSAPERQSIPGTATAAVERAAPTSPPANVAAESRKTPAPLSCRAEIGAVAAGRRVEICRNVSPATRPPCNAANSCAMIEDEIARSCALFDGKGAPMAGCTPAPKSMEAAVAVVRRYYSAINARDFDTAWAQWGDNGRAGQTREAFEAGFAHTRTVNVAIGTLTPGDGGAGSIYQPVPVTVHAVLDDGRHQEFRGTYIVRRVNDVDGASAGALRWHIGSAQLRPVSSP